MARIQTQVADLTSLRVAKVHHESSIRALEEKVKAAEIEVELQRAQIEDQSSKIDRLQ